jgi:hypothetical protein
MFEPSPDDLILKDDEKPSGNANFTSNKKNEE